MSNVPNPFMSKKATDTIGTSDKTNMEILTLLRTLDRKLDALRDGQKTLLRHLIDVEKCLSFHTGGPSLPPLPKPVKEDPFEF